MQGIDSKSRQLKARTKIFAVQIVKLFQACRARSKQEFVSKMGVVAEEADESVLWLELLGDAGSAVLQFGNQD